MTVTIAEDHLASFAPEPWRDKRGLARHYACSVRWIEARMVEGMPHTYIAGRAKFKASRTESWLHVHGFIEHRGGDVA